MENSIATFQSQFDYVPVIENEASKRPFARIILAGMGGSHLAADIVADLIPFLPLRIHSDYGLPAVSPLELQSSLLIASSYSGNTEEVLDFADKAFENKLNLLCIAAGGTLLARAKQRGIPYIELPNTGLQPRLAIGFSTVALLKAIGAFPREDITNLSKINATSLKEAGEEVARSVNGRIPVIYASTSYRSVALNWKIKFNETAKIPAFFNVVPELNHNEMQGFGGIGNEQEFIFFFLKASDDEPRNLRRMEITEALYRKKGFDVVERWMEGETKGERIFKTLLVADWAACQLALTAGVPADAVPLVEEFKKELAS